MPNGKYLLFIHTNNPEYKALCAEIPEEDKSDFYEFRGCVGYVRRSFYTCYNSKHYTDNQKTVNLLPTNLQANLGLYFNEVLVLADEDPIIKHYCYADNMLESWQEQLEERKLTLPSEDVHPLDVLIGAFYFSEYERYRDMVPTNDTLQDWSMLHLESAAKEYKYEPAILELGELENNNVSSFSMC